MTQLLPHLRRIAQAEVTDAELLQAFLADRDEGAFATLVRRHGPMVLAVCQRVLRDRHDAEDACQATFLVLVRKARSLQRPEQLSSWLYGVAYRTALGARSSGRRFSEHELVARVQEEPIAELVWQELQLILDEELQRLPLKYRLPIVLCYLEGKSNRATARQLGWSVGTLVTRLSKAKHLLRQQLAQRGLALSVGVVSTALAQGMTAGAMPPLLISSTVQAALLLQTGGALTGVLSIKVIALMEGTVQAMLWTKIKLVTIVVLVALGVGTAAYQASAQDQPRDDTKESLRLRLRNMELERQELKARIQQLETQNQRSRVTLNPEQEQALKDLQAALTLAQKGFRSDPTRRQSIQKMTEIYQQLTASLGLARTSTDLRTAIDFFVESRLSESKPDIDYFAIYDLQPVKPAPVGESSRASFRTTLDVEPSPKNSADVAVKAIGEDGLVLIEVGEKTELKPGNVLEFVRAKQSPDGPLTISILFQKDRFAVGKLISKPTTEPKTPSPRKQ